MAEQALDPKTRVLLYKLVNGGVLDSVNGVISTGKEAVIMHADGGPGPQESDEPMNVPKECAVKIFKTTLNEFKTRDKYIRVSIDFIFSRESNSRIANVCLSQPQPLRIMSICHHAYFLISKIVYLISQILDLTNLIYDHYAYQP